MKTNRRKFIGTTLAGGLGAALPLKPAVRKNQLTNITGWMKY